MKNKKIIRYTLYSICVLFLLFLVSVAVIYAVIFLEVRKVCNKAHVSNDSCVPALIKVLDSENASVKEKNDAIWVLGQIADEKALPVLEKIYTGEIPEREPLDKVISQYELKKAIHWINDGNWTSWMYFKFR